ncbi:phage antirepressor KilAC domain-containing protein [Acinetobacter sp. ANC 3926]|uniref:ORF6N domain-containing protein n=1 Tax=Acinetobacter genomosp. 15BJ TaxID=106651 RepID=UPI001F4AB733|nr:ORF6N domain-containing protein [Acinetobacter genomosp. 15BJ]MCH7292301.1 phage antirepressor KilAC domain-containing protein [Acinetobacter genomosp. 15BJ]
MNTLVKSNICVADVKTPVIEFKSERVLMTEQLAKLYETVSVNIHKNFSRNFERFTEGKHFYKVEGNELRELKNSLTDFQVVSPNTRSIILWTEKGAARHAKMLDTEQAWNVFEQLEECYFAVKNGQFQPVFDINNPVHLLQAIEVQAKKNIELSQKVEVLEPKAQALDVLSQNRNGYLCLTDAAKHLHVRVKDLTNLLANKKIIYRRATSNPIKKGKWAAYERIIQKGWLFHDYVAGEKPDGTDYAPQVLVTPKGMAHIALLVTQTKGILV